MSSIRENIEARFNDTVTLEELVDYVADIAADSMWWLGKNDVIYDECMNQFETLTEAISRIFEIYGDSLDELTDNIIEEKTCDIYEKRYGYE